MNNFKKHIILILLFTFSLSAFSQRVKDGVLDLSDADFQKTYLVAGNWEFYWNELFTPEELKNIVPKNENYIKVNGDWNGYNLNGKSVGYNGFATYKLLILAPAGSYTMQFHQVLSAYKVWINNDLISTVGTVGTDKASSKPKLEINEINFTTPKDTIEVVIQVSNFHHSAGGLQEKIFFGRTNKIQHRTTKKLLVSFFIIGAELIFGLYFFFLFFFRQKNLSYIFLSLAILVFILFELVNGEMILIRYFPQISWNWAKRIDFFSNYVRLLFFALFVWYSFREYEIFNKHVLRAVIFASSIYVLIVLFTPASVFSKTLISFMAWGSPAFLYILFITFKGLLKKVPYILYSFIGMLALNISAFNDMFYNLNLINTGYYSSYGLLLLFIGNSIMISLKYTDTSKRVKNLSEKYKNYAILQSKLVLIQSYDLKTALEILDEFLNPIKIELLIENKVLICECIKANDKIKCGNLEKNFSYTLDIESIDNLKDKTQTVIRKNEIIIPFVEENNLKSILYLTFENSRKIKNEIAVLEMLMPQISTIIDNYSYYWNLEILNKNLEDIVEARTKLAYKQKQELEYKNVELDEKIEELNISSQIVEDLNDELKNQREEIDSKNQQLDVLRKQAEKQKIELEEKQHNIHSSINYAKRIQSAFFSSIHSFPFNDVFVLNKPKEIVSGDFYFSFVINDVWLLGLIDTTGRNVSATFLSFFIESIIAELIDKKVDLINNPATVIEELRYKYHQNIGMVTQSEIDDSFDISLCSINIKTGRLKFSAANQSFVVVRKNEPILLKGDNYSIGGYYTNFNDKFSTKEFDLKVDDKLYLYSDGYYKQMGQERRSKFGLNKFVSLLTSTSHLSLEKQKEQLLEKHLTWKGSVKQVDDILIIGLKFSKLT